MEKGTGERKYERMSKEVMSMLCFYKSLVLSLFIVVFTLVLPLSVQAADTDEVKTAISDTVLPFFEALTSGDVQAIEFYIGGNLALDMKTLLQENRKYSEILRRHYANAVVRVGDTFKGAENIIVEAEIDFPGGVKQLFSLRLSRDKDERWKIVKQTECLLQ